MLVKKLVIVGCSLSVAISLSGCTAMNSAKSKLADIQTNNFSKKLPNGNVLYFNTNLPPTTAWQCRSVGRSQSYDWLTLQTEAQFHWKGTYGLLIDKAVAYLTANNFNANYVNMSIPDEKYYAAAASSKLVYSYDKPSNSKVILSFFQCKFINPQHQLGMTYKEGVGVGIGKGGKAIQNNIT